MNHSNMAPLLKRRTAHSDVLRLPNGGEDLTEARMLLVDMLTVVIALWATLPGNQTVTTPEGGFRGPVLH